MKVFVRSWLVALAAGLAGNEAARAMEPAPAAELAQPIGAQPIEIQPIPATAIPVEATITDDPAEDEQVNVTAQPLDAGDAPAVTPEPNVEVIQERYPNGVVRLEREVTLDADGNYVPHGLWRQFDPTGRLIAEGRFVESKKEGIWRRLYRGDDAALLATAPYHTFTPPFVSQATFAKGHLHGKWTIADAKQRIAHEIEFVEGERHGAAVWYYPGGQVMLQAQYDHGRVHGDVLHYGPDSQLLAKETYESGRKLAPKIEYHDAQLLVKKSEAMYLHAALTIKTPDNWDRLTLAVFESRGQDEKHGPFTAWHTNGQLARQGEFRYDLPVGTFRYWYANGQKQMEGTYVDGRQQGSWTWWHENGLKSIAGEYRDAAPIGSWSWWQASGKLAHKSDLSPQPLVGPTPEAESEPREAKVRLADPVVELR